MYGKSWSLRIGNSDWAIVSVCENVGGLPERISIVSCADGCQAYTVAVERVLRERGLVCRKIDWEPGEAAGETVAVLSGVGPRARGAKQIVG